MGILKIFGVVVVLSALVGVYVIAFQPNYLPQAVAQYHEPVRDNVDKGTSWMTHLVSNVKNSQIKPFGQVVSTSELVGVDEQYSKPLPQKAFEYGRYQYCQQVVKEYELAQEKRQKPSDTKSSSEE